MAGLTTRKKTLGETQTELVRGNSEQTERKRNCVKR